MDVSDSKGKDELPPKNEWTWERFKEVDATGGQVGIYCPHHGKFVRMNGNGNMDGSDPKGAHELPGGWTWERFKVVDGQDGSIALWCPIHGRYVRMRDNCRMDWSDSKGEHDLPPPNEWTWERFKEVDGGFGQIALYSPHHGKFVRMNGNGNMDCSDSR